MCIFSFFRVFQLKFFKTLNYADSEQTVSPFFKATKLDGG